MADRRHRSKSRDESRRSPSPGQSKNDREQRSPTKGRDGRGETRERSASPDNRRTEGTKGREGTREREKERKKGRQADIDAWLEGMNGGKKDSTKGNSEMERSPLTADKQHFAGTPAIDHEDEERLRKEEERDKKKKKKVSILDGVKKALGLGSDPPPPWKEEEKEKKSTSRDKRSTSREKKEQSRGINSRDTSRDGKNKTDTRQELPEWNFVFLPENLVDDGYGEAFCSRCGDILYVDKESGLPYDPQPPLFDELCPHCGKPWPKNQALPEELERARDRRITKAGFKNVVCKRCANSGAAARSQYVDGGVQADSRDLDSAPPTEVGDGKFINGHYCKKVEIVRNEVGVKQPRYFWEDILRPKGKKKALLIGVNYYGQKGELKGCVTDVDNMKDFLKSNGYEDRNIDILIDSWNFKPPTRKKIISHMQRLVQDAQSGDSLFVHYSGHGGQKPDEFDGDELDGQDEGIYPVDHKINGFLRDDTMYGILTDLPEGVHLTAIFDSCHSGSVLDLPYMMSNDRVQRIQERRRKPHNIEGRVILWSGCRDAQTSADATIGGERQGAMSYAFIRANRRLQRRKESEEQARQRREHDINYSPGAFDYTYSELLTEIRDIINEKGFQQRPQLSSSQALDPDEHLVYV